MSIITIKEVLQSLNNFFQVKDKSRSLHLFIYLFIGLINPALGSDIIFSGFYVGSHNSGPDEKDICAAFINLKISNTKLIFEMDHFDEKNKRKKHIVTFYLTGNPNNSPYKKILYAENPSYYTVGNTSSWGTFEYWLGKTVVLEYKNNNSEIIGKFGGKNVFYLIRTDKILKLPKNDELFVPLNGKEEFPNVGFLLIKNKNGYVRECVISEFDAQKNYNGSTIIVGIDWIYKGQAKNSKFIDNYTLDQWAHCYFSGHDEEVVRWVVVLKQTGDVKPGAYGYNCNNKLARLCDSDFKNCKQLIEKEVDYSLITALAALVGGSALVIDAISNSDNSSGRYSGRAQQERSRSDSKSDFQIKYISTKAETKVQFKSDSKKYVSINIISDGKANDKNNYFSSVTVMNKSDEVINGETCKDPNLDNGLGNKFGYFSFKPELGEYIVVKVSYGHVDSKWFGKDEYQGIGTTVVLTNNSGSYDIEVKPKSK